MKKTETQMHRDVVTVRQRINRSIRRNGCCCDLYIKMTAYEALKKTASAEQKSIQMNEVLAELAVHCANIGELRDLRKKCGCALCQKNAKRALYQHHLFLRAFRIWNDLSDPAYRLLLMRARSVVESMRGGGEAGGTPVGATKSTATMDAVPATMTNSATQKQGGSHGR